MSHPEGGDSAIQRGKGSMTKWEEKQPEYDKIDRRLDLGLQDAPRSLIYCTEGGSMKMKHDGITSHPKEET